MSKTWTKSIKKWVIEFQFMRGDSFFRVIGFEIDLHRKTDHPGLFCEAGILGLMFYFNVYSTNHYDDDKEEYIDGFCSENWLDCEGEGKDG